MTRLAWPLVLAALVAAGCGGASGDAAAGTSTPAPASGTSATVDLQAIFPPGAGRELVLSNCQNCHNFVPIVILQMDQDAWLRNSRDHRERVSSLNDEQFAEMYRYLTTNFGPHRPVPKLPADLLKSWTTY